MTATHHFRRNVLARATAQVCWLSLATCAMQAAHAQDASPSLQRVEITGSAVKRIDAETSVPVTILKVEDLKKQGITTVEQMVKTITSSQAQQGTSQVVGLGTGGASFADIRGLGQNKTLVLLNGRRIANNAIDGAAPDLNMIPFAALDRVEVLRDGASSLYGTDAIGGVINFITRKDYQGASISVSADQPENRGGQQASVNLGFGYGSLDDDGFNVMGFFNSQKQDRVSGTERTFNQRYAGGLSASTSPGNYFQDGKTGNPLAPGCNGGAFSVPNPKNPTGCQISTSKFVDYVPASEQNTAMLRGALKINAETTLNLEYFASSDKITSMIAPVPYGALYVNRLRPDGSLNPYYPGNSASSITPNIPLNSNYTEDNTAAGIQPGFVHARWRDTPNGQRSNIDHNDQQRLLANIDGFALGWDYQAGLMWNENKVRNDLAGYSDGLTITTGVLNGVINPFGPQDAGGTALLAGAGRAGTVTTGLGSTKTADVRASRELSDYLGAGRAASLAIGAEYRTEDFTWSANKAFAAAVVGSTGIDPDTINTGNRNVAAVYAEFNLPVSKQLELTAAFRTDQYSDIGTTTNPKLGLRYQPSQGVLIRSSYSTGFRAPSIYELHSAQSYTNSEQFDDPVNCPGGTAIPGKSAAANCAQQFQTLNGGNTTLKPEKSKNFTLGMVLEPTKSLTLGVDFWMIELRDQINIAPFPAIFAGYNGIFAKNFVRTAQGNLAIDGSQCPDPVTCGYVDNRYQNLGGLSTNGLDLNASYRLNVKDGGMYTFSMQSTYVNKYDYQDYEDGPWNHNVAKYMGNKPIFQWQHRLSVDWHMREYGAGLALNYKSDYTDSPDAPTEGFVVQDYTTVDIYGSLSPNKNISLIVGVRNLFDKDPPLSYQTKTFQAGYDPRYTDVTGRTFYLRGTYNF